ncbi:MAG: type IV pilus assembly protein PilM [Verrucomicrobia bacterium]|nr:MAG: type IV pilus assembly protein PilM [Verrucomicrobiota bacterium]
MAIPTRIISLNLGSQTIGLAEFRVQAHGGLVLLGYRLRELPVEAAGEEMRRTQMTIALREMLAELHIKRGLVNYALPAQSVFSRFVNLPAIEQEKIEKIVSFEAQQNVPFPIDEVVWDYQLVGGGLDQQVQVVLIAIKVDLLEEINAAVEETGLRTSIVDVAPMARYNAFRYNYSNLSGCSLLAYIGARMTNVLFIEPGKVFSRSVPIGGSSITAAIAKEFGESFREAETRKRRDGFVSLGGAYAEPADPDVARVSKIVRTIMTRLHAELMRSIGHYRGQQQGSRPERIFLCGGSASMPYMREFFKEKLHLPVEFFNPLQNVTVSESAPMLDVTRSAHLLGELVGLALRSANACPMELNLRSASVVRRQELEKRRPFFTVAAACFLVALIGWSAYYTRAAQVTAQSTEALQQKNDTMRAAEARLDKLKKQAASLDTVATPLITAINDRNFWPQILDDLNSRLPEADIWITELAATSGGKVLGAGERRIVESAAPSAAATSPAPATGAAGPAIDGIMVRGLYLYNPKQQEIVLDYFRNLANSPFFTIDPKTPERVIKSNSVPNDAEWAFPYELQLTLRKPVKLP